MSQGHWNGWLIVPMHLPTARAPVSNWSSPDAESLSDQKRQPTPTPNSKGSMLNVVALTPAEVLMSVAM